jgi:glycosyltransferase involved in cell wall biosynthesis
VKDPELSIVIPAFNAAPFLAPLLDKLRAAPSRWEIIVVDDGSTDDTPHLRKQSPERILWLHRPRGGPSAARNTGLRQARAPYLAFLDADDEWPASHPAETLASARDGGWDIVLGRTLLLAPAGAESFLPIGDPFHTFLMGAGIYRRDLFERIGGFDEELFFGEDADWFLRAREQGARMALREATTLHYRRHRGNASRSSGAATSGLLRALHLSMQRRRSSTVALAALPCL